MTARKLLEIANGIQALQDRRIHIEKINGPDAVQGCRPGGVQRGVDLAIVRSWLALHESDNRLAPSDRVEPTQACGTKLPAAVSRRWIRMPHLEKYWFTGPEDRPSRLRSYPKAMELTEVGTGPH